MTQATRPAGMSLTQTGREDDSVGILLPGQTQGPEFEPRGLCEAGYIRQCMLVVQVMGGRMGSLGLAHQPVELNW